MPKRAAPGKGVPRKQQWQGGPRKIYRDTNVEFKMCRDNLKDLKQM
jgi:hypothetical protein